MEWTEVKIYTTSQGIEPVSAMLLETGIGGIQVEDDKELKKYIEESSEYWDYVDEELLNKNEEAVRLIVYVSDNPYGYEILMKIKEGINRLKDMELGIDLGSLEIKLKQNLNDEQWLNKWKEFYKPFKVGKKLLVKPIWEEVKNNGGRIVFNINPGHIFGTGLHQSTQLCMTELEKYCEKGKYVLDMGCGSGILSIISLLLGAEYAAAVDIDENAIKTAYENAALNGIDKSRYFVTSGNIISDTKLWDRLGYKKYDIITANIIADVICAVSPTAPKFLKKGGVFISSGIIKERTDDVCMALEENGFDIVNIASKDEWVGISAVINR